MRKLLLAVMCIACLGAAPSRVCTYTTGTTIEASCVSSNEDALFAYTQAGVDTYVAASVNEAAIGNQAVNTAEIKDSAVTTGKILDATIAAADLGTDSVAADEIAAGAVGTSEIATDGVDSAEIAANAVGASEIAVNSVALSTDTTGNYVATVADAGNTTITVANSGSEGAAVTVDAVDVNCSNCIDGTDIALGSDAQGDVMYYNGTDWVRLGAGTNGDFLKTQGAGANPTWFSAGAWIFVETLDLATTSVTSSTLPTDSDVFMVVFDNVVSAAGGVHLRFNGDTDSSYQYTSLATTTLASSGATTSLRLIDVGGEILSGHITFDRDAVGGRNAVGVACHLSATDPSDAVTLRGHWDENADVTTITFFNGGSGTMAGEAHIYKLTKT